VRLDPLRRLVGLGGSFTAAINTSVVPIDSEDKLVTPSPSSRRYYIFAPSVNQAVLIGTQIGGPY
jgi:hypothetical protein